MSRDEKCGFGKMNGRIWLSQLGVLKKIEACLNELEIVPETNAWEGAAIGAIPIDSPAISAGD
jgi:hypothetical protein